MNESNAKTGTKLLKAATLLLAVSLVAVIPARAAGVDPAATQILKRMADHLAGLQQFSVNTHITIEELLDSGQKIDVDVSASILISRPDRLRAERRGDVVDQVFYYDGRELILYDLSDKVYAKVAAPDTIEGALVFAQTTLGLIIPASDLVYPNAYTLLMEDVTSAMVIGKTVIDGVRCDHLAFSRPGVDFQVWVADQGPPLPYKYAVTDTSTPALLSVMTAMSDWDPTPSVSDTSFSFEPPRGAKEIPFMRLDEKNSASN